MKSESKTTFCMLISLAFLVVLVNLGFGKNSLSMAPAVFFAVCVMYIVTKEQSYSFYLFIALQVFIFCVLFLYIRANLLTENSSWDNIGSMSIGLFIVIMGGATISFGFVMIISRIQKRKSAETNLDDEQPKTEG